ncbi:MAG: cation-translocating P-type ATPase [Candidatus Woesearchaeota archaeon]
MEPENDAETEMDHYWHLRTVEEVIEETKTSTDEGLSDKEATDRKERFGANKVVGGSSFKWYDVLLGKLNSLLIYILLVAGAISFIAGDVIEGIVIGVIIVMTVALGFYQEYKADRTVQALEKLTAKKVTVLRGGKRREINAEELVIGDVVHLHRGDIVPADLRLIETSGLRINESVITGESVERVKDEKYISDENVSLGDMTNMAFSSSHVTQGSGVGVVVETGQNTVMGKISYSIEHLKTEKSPVQDKIDRMSSRLSYIVLTIAVFLFIVMLVQGNELHYSILLISALIIAGIPESFPLALTLTFTNGIKKMARKNAIVKDLNSVETLGTTTVICTDKTGTLTENTMRVTEFTLPDNKFYRAQGTGYEPINTFYKNGTQIAKDDIVVSKTFFKTMVLCNEAELERHNHTWRLSGEATEGSLLVFAKSFDIDEELLQEDNKRVFVQPFDPAKKVMKTVHNHISSDTHYQFYMKGAGEIVLDTCTMYRDNDGNTHPLSESTHQKLSSQMDKCNKRGLRVIALASKELEKTDDEDVEIFVKQHLDSEYVFEGFVGIEDPIRKEVYDAVTQCQKAGIKPVMITGDHKLIAETIGKKLNILSDSEKQIILEGHELDRMSDKNLDEIISDVVIFARTNPEHKLRIVEAFQRKGEIVGMTGDGVNDAPALKKANIGISMGKNGTEVAREASNMVLADDNFATISEAVKEGRTVYSNIRRFIYYLLTGNFTEIGLMVLAVLIGVSLPLTALMILFINLVTSTIPALALSIEPTHDKVMHQKPRKPKERLLSEYILTKIIVLIPIILFGTFGLFLWESRVMGSGIEKAQTIAFVTLTTFELFHSLNARRLHTTIFNKGFFRNPYIFGAILSSFALIAVAVHTSVGQVIFSTIPLSGSEWVTILVVSVLIVVFSEVVKLAIQSEVKEQNNLQDANLKIE